VPEGCAGQAVRCPSCDATFEARVEEVPATNLGGGASPDPVEAFSDQPKPAAPEPAPVPEADPDQAEAARRSRFLGGWPVVRGGLGWIMAGEGIELAVQGLDLLMVGYFAMSHLASGPGFDFFDDWHEWGIPRTCVRMLALLVAGVCMLVGLARCQRYPAPGPARGIAVAALVACSFAYLFRALCSPFLHPYGLAIYMWRGWFSGVILLTRWVADGLLILFLYHLGRDWRDEPTQSRLRWLLALLMADVVLHLGQATGMMETWETLAEHVFFLDDFLLGALFRGAVAALHLAMAAQLLRVLVAARRALAAQPEGHDPEFDAA
jgi:hypothetical protein